MIILAMTSENDAGPAMHITVALTRADISEALRNITTGAALQQQIDQPGMPQIELCVIAGDTEATLLDRIRKGTAHALGINPSDIPENTPLSVETIRRGKPQ